MTQSAKAKRRNRNIDFWGQQLDFLPETLGLLILKTALARKTDHWHEWAYREANRTWFLVIMRGLFAECRGSLSQSESLHQRALRIAQEDWQKATSLACLACLAFRNGKKGWARTLSIRAIKLYPDNECIWELFLQSQRQSGSSASQITQNQRIRELFERSNSWVRARRCLLEMKENPVCSPSLSEGRSLVSEEFWLQTNESVRRLDWSPEGKSILVLAGGKVVVWEGLIGQMSERLDCRPQTFIELEGEGLEAQVTDARWVAQHEMVFSFWVEQVLSEQGEREAWFGIGSYNLKENRARTTYLDGGDLQVFYPHKKSWYGIGVDPKSSTVFLPDPLGRGIWKCTGFHSQLLSDPVGGPTPQPTPFFATQSNGPGMALALHDRRVQIWPNGLKDSLSTTILTPQHRARITALSWCGDGSIVAVADAKGYVYFWNAFSGMSEYCLKVHCDAVVDFSFSADLSLFATLSKSGELGIRSRSNGQLIYSKLGFKNARTLEFHPASLALAIHSPRAGSVQCVEFDRVWQRSCGILSHTPRSSSSGCESLGVSQKIDLQWEARELREKNREPGLRLQTLHG